MKDILQNKHTASVEAEELLYQALNWSAEAQAARQKRLQRGGVIQVEAWQKERLHRSYADLASQPRYEAATAFFTDELYAPPDLSSRDADIRRMAPMLVRMLPKSAVDTVASALGLQALSLELDVALADLLGADGAGAIDDQRYADAYRRLGRREDRELQIELIMRVGRDLDRLVKNPFIYTTLKLSRGMARLAGLSTLQQFLEHGFGAFRAMDGAGYFLETIETRERALLEDLFAGRTPDFDDPAGAAEAC